MIKSLISYKTVRIKCCNIWSENVNVKMDLPKKPDYRLIFMNFFIADNGRYCAFASDGGVIIEAEDFVPTGQHPSEDFRLRDPECRLIRPDGNISLFQRELRGELGQR